MSRRFKTAVGAGLLALLLAGTLSLQPTSPIPGPSGPDDTDAGPGNLDGDGRVAAPAPEVCLALDRCSRAKYRIAELVVQRCLGLLDGAAALCAIDAYRPASLHFVMRGIYPGCSEEEAYCRAMINWAASVARDENADPALVAELEAELSKRLNGPDALRLPDVALEQYLPPDLMPPAPAAAPAMPLRIVRPCPAPAPVIRIEGPSAAR